MSGSRPDRPVVAVIGGTALAAMTSVPAPERFEVQTEYGPPSAALRYYRLDDRHYARHNNAGFWFLPRHGEPHVLAPHCINYRANLCALKAQGVTDIIALAAVGAIDPALRVGDLVVPDQLIDYSWGRAHTIYDQNHGPVQHVEFDPPYTESLRQSLLASAYTLALPIHDHGCYAAVQGPRLETRAEIDRLAADGASIIGMTGMPEAGLARELGLNYACLALIMNPAAGRGPLTSPDATAVLTQRRAQLETLVLAVITNLLNA